MDLKQDVHGEVKRFEHEMIDLLEQCEDKENAIDVTKRILRQAGYSDFADALARWCRKH